MAGIANSALLDLLNTTKEKLPEGRFHHTQKFQRYEVMNRWFQEDKVRIISGTEITDNIALSETGNARQVRLYQKSAINVGETQHRIKAPWTQAETHYALERREMLRNRAPARFVNLLNSRKRDAAMGVADLLEQRAWLAPESSDDDLNPMGIPYWVPQMDAAVAGAGFFGGSATGFTTTANIDPATANDNKPAISGGQARWRSWYAGGKDTTTGIEYYLTLNDAAVVTMMLAMYKVNFESPFVVADLVDGPKANFRIYMNTMTKIAYEQLAKQQNNQLGNDLQPFQGIVAFKRVPIIHMSVLDTDTADPIYFINHNEFYPYVQEGDYLREDEAIRSPDYHNVFIVFTDISYNFFCSNRRCQAVMSKTAEVAM